MRRCSGWRKEYPKDKFPTDVVYGDFDQAGVRLITCGGSLDRQARSSDDDIVVFADSSRLTSHPDDLLAAGWSSLRACS